MGIDVAYTDRAKAELAKLPPGARERIESDVATPPLPPLGEAGEIEMQIVSGDGSYYYIGLIYEYDQSENIVLILDMVSISY